MLISDVRIITSIFPALAATLIFFSSPTQAVEKGGTNLSGQSRDSELSCGGELELRVWKLWETEGRPFLRDQLIQKRLTQEGDSYALYDIQGYFHNLTAMAERCARSDRLIQIADEAIAAYQSLQPLPVGEGRGWICGGGRTCSDTNRLRGNEVQLVSVQGLGFFSALSYALITSGSLKAKSHPLIRLTAKASLEHLHRWGDKRAISSWKRRMAAKSSEIKNGSSELFFTDRDLWQLTIYSNVAGILKMDARLRDDMEKAGLIDDQSMMGVVSLFSLFKTRTTFEVIPNPNGGSVVTGDLDRGFWRLFADNRFASYSSDVAPNECKKGEDVEPNRKKIEPLEPVESLGWDISHARRLVHAFNAVDKNRVAIEELFQVPQNSLPSKDVAKSFAAQLLFRVWNGDLKRPLFKNYWNGSNGWYRVGYGVESGRCNPGIPPYGLSDSFATGGYATWSKFYPELGVLGESIYRASQESTDASRIFISKFYPSLGIGAASNTRMLAQLMFWPSLIANKS
ncbi:hypothetical protein [Variovorax boronicumulans]|uniref:hypothetical protein n=1 Tax=Variovorax boronicumulans TaxID=436515 RepID=UPI0012E57291|nr:hypothetical protein [Variovorax boronicumulans]GER19496.1 hypothetical protein VCH24_45300 [Variovorax boronicumulans]